MRRRVGWLIVPFCWALACGGRFEKTTQQGDDDDVGGVSTGQGGSVQPNAGSVSLGGATGKGGAISRGGKKPTGGKAGTGGAVGTGGTTIGVGGGCACDPIACAPGYLIVPDPNGCCYHCEIDVKSCAVQREKYLAFRTMLIEKYSSIGCTSDADCSLFYEKNACGFSSCPVSLPNSMFQNLESNLDSYAQMLCNPACPPTPEPPCDVEPPAVCFKGYRCE
jgi:hypothetical protein